MTPSPETIQQIRDVVTAWHALRVEEVRIWGPVIIDHAGRCGRETNALMRAVEQLAIGCPLSALAGSSPARLQQSDEWLHRKATEEEGHDVSAGSSPAPFTAYVQEMRTMADPPASPAPEPETPTAGPSPAMMDYQRPMGVKPSIQPSEGPIPPVVIPEARARILHSLQTILDSGLWEMDHELAEHIEQSLTALSPDRPETT